MHLRSFCKNIFTYKDGQQALNGLNDIIQSDGLIPEIILLDLNMPVKNGWEFLDHLSEILYRNKIAVFIVSSSINPLDLDRSKTYKCVLDYIVKPVSNDDLDKILKTHNENEQ